MSLQQASSRKGPQWWFALAFFAMGGFALLGYVLWAAHAEIWRDASQTAENYAELIESRFEAVLRRVDDDMQELAAGLPLASLNSPGSGQIGATMSLAAEKKRHAYQEILEFRIEDNAGKLLYRSGRNDSPVEFERNSAEPSTDFRPSVLVVSPVLRQINDGHLLLRLSRGIFDEHGELRGSVSALLDLDYFDRFFDSVRLGQHGALVIRRLDDHTLVLRRPLLAEEINKPLAADHPMRPVLAGAPLGTLEFVAQTDGVRRIYAYRKMADYPFYVLAGLAHSDVTAVWRQRALTVGVLGFAMLCAMAFLLYWLFRRHKIEVLASERMRQQQAQLRESQRVAGVGSWEEDLQTHHMLWSDEVYRVLEIDRQETATRSLYLHRVHPDDRFSLASATQAALAAKEPCRIEHRLLLPDGRIKHLLVCAETTYDQNGVPLRTLGSLQDLTSVRQMEAQMQLLASAFQYSGEAILITDRENKIVTVNPAFTTLTGYTAEEAVGRNPKFLSAGRSTKSDYEAMWEGILQRGFWQGEIWDRRKDGAIYPKWISVSVIRDDSGEIRYHVAHFSDISAERAIEAQLQHIAHHDVLTGLLNRHSLKGRLDQALAAARREGGRLALLFIDLDRFKGINDTLGHHIGDELLIEVARRLQESVRDSDVVARLGGDEFVIMLTGIEHSSAVAMVAEKLVFSVGDPYLIEGHDLYTSPSIGIAIYPMDGEDGDTLMKNADAAMYHAKSSGRNNFQFFDRKMNDAAQERLTLEHNLRQALMNDEFCLHFQPILDVKTGRVHSVEALIRWQHPEQGMIPPGKFIPIAEETGLIQPIGEWVFWAACRQLADFYAAGILDVKMGINISAMQMRNDNLPVLAKGAIDALGLDAKDLIFEITESVAMNQPDDTVRILDCLHDMGIALAIDDFGTGYSSLSYLKMFPIDHLKLDRAFVSEIGEGPDSATICDATISLGHSLGLRLVAEGVETEEQFEYLRGKGCDLVQGFLFSRPVPAEQVMAFIQQRHQQECE